MKKFLFKILIFLSVPMLLLAIPEFIIYFNKNDIFSEKELEVAFNNNLGNYAWIDSVRADTLIMLSGSSTVKNGLSCSALNNLCSKNSKYVSIAGDARDPIETYFILKNTHTERVSAIYFGIDPWIYAKKYYKYRPNRMYLDFNFIEILQYNYEHDLSAFLKRQKSFFKYIWPNSDKDMVNKNFIIPYDFGSVALEYTPKNFDLSITKLFQIKKYGWSETQFTYLKKISDLCRERKIKFAVFIFPKRSDYSTAYKEQCKDIHREYILNLKNVGFFEPIFGKLDQLDSWGDSIYFADQYHLNSKGQKKYSELFYEMTQKKMDVFSEKYSWFLNN